MPDNYPQMSQQLFFSTGEVAELCSVTPNSVLRWIHEGKLPASRTAGGHHRIPRSSLLTLLKLRQQVMGTEQDQRLFQYCWEFHAKSGELKRECLKCVVYRSRASRCFELSQLPAELGHSRVYCTNTCSECEYFHSVHSSFLTVLIVSTDLGMNETLEPRIDKNRTLHFVENEYHCSQALESLRPHYIILDCALGRDRCRLLAEDLGDDARIPFARVILVGKREQLPEECSQIAFAYVASTLTASLLADLIRGL